MSIIHKTLFDNGSSRDTVKLDRSRGEWKTEIIFKSIDTGEVLYTTKW